MSGISTAQSSMGSGQVQVEAHYKMLKKTLEVVESQTLQLLAGLQKSLPEGSNFQTYA